MCSHYPRDPKRGKGTTWGREWIARIVNPLYPNTRFIDMPLADILTVKLHC